MGVKFNHKIHLSPLCIFDNFKERKKRAILLLEEGFSIAKVMEISALDFSTVNNLYTNINKLKKFFQKIPKEALEKKIEKFQDFSEKTSFLQCTSKLEDSKLEDSKLEDSKNIQDFHFQDFKGEKKNTEPQFIKSQVFFHKQSSNFDKKEKVLFHKESSNFDKEKVLFHKKFSNFSEREKQCIPYNEKKFQNIFQGLPKEFSEEMDLVDPLCQRIERAIVLKKFSIPFEKIVNITHLLYSDIENLKDSFSIDNLQKDLRREIQENISQDFSYALQKMLVTDFLENRIKRTFLLWEIYQLLFVDISKITHLNFSDIRSLIKK